MINIEGLNKAEVLSELYNNCKVVLPDSVASIFNTVTVGECVNILKNNSKFSKILGKSIPVDFTSDIEFNEELYDKENGEGSAQRIVDELRNKSTEINFVFELSIPNIDNTKLESIAKEI